MPQKLRPWDRIRFLTHLTGGSCISALHGGFSTTCCFDRRLAACCRALFFLNRFCRKPCFSRDGLFLACATQHKFCNGMQRLNTTNRPFWISKTICIYESLFASLNLFAIVCISPRFKSKVLETNLPFRSRQESRCKCPTALHGKDRPHFVMSWNGDFSGLKSGMAYLFADHDQNWRFP